MKVFRLFNSGAVLLANIIVFGCLSCYAIPHNESNPCHEMGDHHAEDCSVCQLAQRTWEVKLTTNQNNKEKHIKDFPEPKESFVFGGSELSFLWDIDPSSTIAFKRTDPWIETIVKTIVLRI